MGNAGSAIQQLFAAVFFAKNGQWRVCLNVLMLNYSLNVFRAVVPVDKRSFWCQKHQQLGFLMVPLTLWQLKHQPWVWPQVWGQRLWFPIITATVETCDCSVLTIQQARTCYTWHPAAAALRDDERWKEQSQLTRGTRFPSLTRSLLFEASSEPFRSIQFWHVISASSLACTVVVGRSLASQLVGSPSTRMVIWSPRIHLADVWTSLHQPGWSLEWSAVSRMTLL